MSGNESPNSIHERNVNQYSAANDRHAKNTIESGSKYQRCETRA